MGILTGELDFHTAIDSLPRMPKQREFISCPERNAAYVGGQGSGKSVSLCTSLILNAANDPHGFSLVGRLNMPALETSTMKTFLELVPEEYGEWADTKKTYNMSNGHQIIFRHLDISDPKVVGHVKSMNLSAAYVDEATEVSEEVYFLLVGRLRRKTAPRHIVRLASNPAGHDWIWRHFFDPERKQSWKDNNRGITASSMENPFLPEEYIQNMLNTYPADWADRFIYGHFSDFSDLVYKEFTEESHVWDAAKAYAMFGGSNVPPKNWPVIVGIDIGSDIDPWAICLVAVAPNGMLFQFEEVYGNSLLIRTIAQELHLKLGERVIDGMAYDYANRQAALELAEYNINGYPAIKEVRPGLFKTAQYMHVDPRLEHPFNAKVKGSPRFFISSDCINTRRELSAYKWAKDRSGTATGEPSHENSHSPDAVRYALHTFRPLPEKLSPPKLWENPALDEMSRLYWFDSEKRKDNMEKFRPHKAQPASMQEWLAQSKHRPLRFQKPNMGIFQKAGRA
jgi:PBSX family phage terminase large subunit